MSVPTVKGFIQAKNATITGLSVGVCPVNWPESEITTFPLQLTKKAEGTSRKVAGKTFGRDTWKLHLFLARQHQDNYTQAVNDADTYIQRFRDMYTDPANFTLSYTPTIVQVLSNEPEAIRDTGLIELDYFQKVYYGVIFDLIILEQEI
jgi:hypothetical protein